MTITYTAEVATCKKFGCFIKLLARWRGSIYKLVWMDLLLFLFLYYSVNLVYIYLLDEVSQRTFESVVYYCANYSSLIPLSFVLGFYVNLVMTRWWQQYITIPWPDSVAVYVSVHVHGQDERGRVMRRTVMRYVCLCLTIVFTMISPCVKKRFPKMKHLVDAGLLLENEKEIIDSMDNAFPKYPKHWMPIIWAASVITRARQEGIIRDDFAVKTIIDELNDFRGRCGTLMYYDFICIPLVYTQVVTIAVYSFFVCSLLAHQWTEFKKDTYEALDFYMPIFITLQFFFYMGWLKVAETLINPFGEDDDDFEVNWMIDRNLQVSYLIVDEMHHEHPELVKDQYWEEVYPSELPYESEVKRDQHPEPSTAIYDVHESPLLSTIKVHADSASVQCKVMQDSFISIRSERFKEAFQRFSQYVDDDLQPAKALPDNSISDIESIQNITSYGPTESSEASVPVKWPNSILDKVSEEEGIEPGEEEEHFAFVEEEVTEQQSTYESDSDSDAFERLRVERQQQRIQRMHDFLRRHFGCHLNIVTPNTEKLKQSTSVSGLPGDDNQWSDGVTKESQSSGIRTTAVIEQHMLMESMNSNLRNLLLTEDNQNIATASSSCARLATTAQLSQTSTDVSGIPRNIVNTKVQFAETSAQIEDHIPQMLRNSPSTTSSNRVVPSMSFSIHPPMEPLNVRRLEVDASTSPLGSAQSLSTLDSSDPDDWEVVGKQDHHKR